MVVHNRYRVAGGEERAVELQLEALARAGVRHRSIVRDSRMIGSAHAAAAMLRGGERPSELAEAVRAIDATVVHVHNIQPLFGPRALAAARRAGAAVVMHLHNFRLFCAIGVAFRDGETCFRCRRGRTLPGLALNCRGSIPESSVYALALARQLPRVLATVDRFVAPSHYAAGQLARLGVPPERIDVLGHYLPAASFAERSCADGGQFALIAGRLAQEKGVEVAIAASASAGAPLKIAGDGPLEPQLREQIARTGASAELLGRVGDGALADLRRRAAIVLVPSLSRESFGLAALEAMAAGVPVIAARSGALPEVVGSGHCVPPADPGALADAIAALWRDPERRRAEGDALIARARERFGEDGYVRGLLGVYERAAQSRAAGIRA